MPPMDGLDLERLVAVDYLEGLSTMPMAEVRAKKAECSRAEGALSYLRRLVGVRLDIVRTELARRADGGTGELSEIIEHLPEILAEGGARTTTGRLVSVDLPDVNHRMLTADLDRIFDVGRAALLAEMDEDEVRRLAERLEALERRVSSDRRALHERLDVIQAEVVRRYKAGEASPGSLLE